MFIIIVIYNFIYNHQFLMSTIIYCYIIRVYVIHLLPLSIYIILTKLDNITYYIDINIIYYKLYICMIWLVKPYQYIITIYKYAIIIYDILS